MQICRFWRPDGPTMILHDLLQNTGWNCTPSSPPQADVWLLLCQAQIWADLTSNSVLLTTQITGTLKRKACRVSPGILLAWLNAFFFKILIICCKIDEDGTPEGGSDRSSVMDWNVTSAYGERREKARGTAKPELFFETPWKLGWWLNKAFSPPKVQQQQQKNLIWK